MQDDNSPDIHSPDSSAEQLQVRLNGQQVRVSTRRLIDLLHESGVRVEVIAVEVNGEVVPRAELETKLIDDGDEIEVVTLVGGG